MLGFDGHVQVVGLACDASAVTGPCSDEVDRFDDDLALLASPPHVFFRDSRRELEAILELPFHHATNGIGDDELFAAKALGQIPVVLVEDVVFDARPSSLGQLDRLPGLSDDVMSKHSRERLGGLVDGTGVLKSLFPVLDPWRESHVIGVERHPCLSCVKGILRDVQWSPLSDPIASEELGEKCVLVPCPGLQVLVAVRVLVGHVQLLHRGDQFLALVVCLVSLLDQPGSVFQTNASTSLCRVDSREEGLLYLLLPC